MASRVSENFLQSDPWELAQIAEPEFLQRGPVTELSDGRRIRTVIPPSERRTMTREDEMKQREQALDLISKETQVEHNRLQQKAALRDEQRKLNTIKQSDQFMNELDDLVPGNEDYEANLAAKIRKNPLSVDHSAVQSQIELLNKQHEKLKGTDEVLQRSQILAEEADERQNLDAARNYLGNKFGPKALADFEDEMTADEAARAADPKLPKKNYAAAAYRRAALQEDEDFRAELKASDIDPNQFNVPEVDEWGNQTGNVKFNRKAAESHVKRMVKPAEAFRAITVSEALEKRKAEAEKDEKSETGYNIEQWSPDDEFKLEVAKGVVEDFNRTRKSLRKTEQPADNSSNAPVDPKEAAKAKAASWFKR